MKTIILPSGELLRGFVSGMLRDYLQSHSPFLGDLFARHAPQASQLMTQVTDYRTMIQLENQLNHEMMAFSRGLLQAMYDESIGELTEWGRSLPHLRHAVHYYLVNASGMWHIQPRTIESPNIDVPMYVDPGNEAVEHFRTTHLQPLNKLVTSWWNHRVAEEPWLLWHCQFLGNDLLVEPGMDYRAADWMRLNQRGEVGQELTGYNVGFDDYDLVNQACMDQLPGRRRALKTTVRITMPVQVQTPVQMLPADQWGGRRVDAVLMSVPEAKAPALHVAGPALPPETPGFATEPVPATSRRRK